LNEESVGFDLNVTGVWSLGITGTNVTVAFMDDGIDHENPDLKDNFVKMIDVEFGRIL
jgi:kexin